jgi:hypothetical protein
MPRVRCRALGPSREYLAGRSQSEIAGQQVWPGLTRYQANWHHKSATATAKVEDYTLRDARHSWAVRARRAGAAFEHIADQLGHVDSRWRTRVYGRFKRNYRGPYSRSYCDHNCDLSRRWAGSSRAADRATASQLVAYVSRESGGTGRRAGLRILWGNPSGFESRLSHHLRLSWEALSQRVIRAGDMSREPLPPRDSCHRRMRVMLAPSNGPCMVTGSEPDFHSPESVPVTAEPAGKDPPDRVSTTLVGS